MAHASLGPVSRDREWLHGVAKASGADHHAIWHFAVFVPDRFYGGIVGAFLAAIAGAAIFGFLVSGLTVPGRNDTELVQALIAVPGAIAALALSWVYGSRTEGEHRPEVL